MAARHETISLTLDTDTEIVPALGGNGRDVTIQSNNSTDTFVLIGGPGVSNESYGYMLKGGQAISFELNGADAIHAITPYSGITLNILSINLEKVL
jgi:hypothetical protein